MTIIKNLKSKITLGTDPELFLIRDDGKYISAIGLVKGTKTEPHLVKELGDGFATQTDNVAVEFNVPPASKAEEFSKNIDIALRYITKLAKKYDLGLSKVSYAIFDDDQVQSDAAQAIGCDPDFNAYSMTINHKESFSDNGRSCGGHLSIGYKNPSVKINVEIIKAMDLFLSIPAVLMDTEERRRTLYGQAGSFRNTPFGLEYRPLSNFWIFDDKLRQWAFRNAMQAVEFVMKGNKIDEELGKLLQDTINHSKKDEAVKLIEKYNLEVITNKEMVVVTTK